MSGLIQRDLLLCFRKYSKLSFIMEVVYFFIFLLFFQNIFGPVIFLMLCSPINMSGLPTTLKELDTNYSGMRSARLLPYSKKDLVKGRFCSAYSFHIFYLAEMLLYIGCHYLITGTVSLNIYFQIFLGGWLIAIFMTSVNLLASFLSGLNATLVFYLVSIVCLAGGILLFTILFKHNWLNLLTQLTSMKRVWLYLIAGCFDVVMLLISYFISLKRFEKVA